MAQPFKLEIRDYNGWRFSFAYCGLARFWCGRSGWHISCKFPNAIWWVLMLYLWTKSLFIPGRPILCWSHRNSYWSKMDNFRGKSPLTSQLWNESELGSHQKSVHFFTLVSFENIKVLYSARTQKISSSGDTCLAWGRWLVQTPRFSIFKLLWQNTVSPFLNQSGQNS